MPDRTLDPSTPPGWALFALLLGLSLTFHGYQSRDGDQAYRLPLLLNQQNPALYANDPFVRAFDAFNPHRGYFALLDLASRVVGLSAALAGLYVASYAVLCVGIDRLTRAAWPEAGAVVGLVALGLVLLARAGNIGTNHLFEPMLLDRGMGFALGWLALAGAVRRPVPVPWISPLAVGLAAWIHPAVGLQLAMLLGVGWLTWALLGPRTGVSVRSALGAILLLGLALLPALALQAGQSARLFEGLPAEEFRVLTAYVQSPQHMLPHLWRRPQWLAWACYVVWALLALRARRPNHGPTVRFRLALLLAVNLVALAAAWVAIELVHDLRITLFQPFRMATVARGLCVVLMAGRAVELWRSGPFETRARAVLLAVGLTGDWSFVVATLVELAAVAAEGLARPVRVFSDRPASRVLVNRAAAIGALVLGLAFLARHDTERGHQRLMAALAALALSETAGRLLSGRYPALAARTIDPRFRRRALGWALVAAWALPGAALVVPWVAGQGAAHGRLVESLARRCRWGEVPADDIERLALWCREHTPPSARFIGPPGPKTFRLWSRRSLAFNRASVPYRAAGLADWFARFRDHLGFQGTLQQFVHAYLADRQRLEHRYDALGDEERAALAVRQGAGYVISAAPNAKRSPKRIDGPLELLHVEGRYAVFRLREPGDRWRLARGR